VDSFADTEFFAGKNCIARKISGFEIFTRKNFRTKKFHVRKKPGFKNSDRENFPAQKISTRKKVRHVPQKIALQQQKDPKRIFRKSCVRPFGPPRRSDRDPFCDRGKGQSHPDPLPVLPVLPGPPFSTEFTTAVPFRQNCQRGVSYETTPIDATPLHRVLFLNGRGGSISSTPGDL